MKTDPRSEKPQGSLGEGQMPDETEEENPRGKKPRGRTQRNLWKGGKWVGEIKRDLEDRKAALIKESEQRNHREEILWLRWESGSWKRRGERIAAC